MTDRERLEELIIEAKYTDSETGSFTEYLTEYLIAHGVVFHPVIPGYDDPYNIAEMAYHNGYAKGKEEHSGCHCSDCQCKTKPALQKPDPEALQYIIDSLPITRLLCQLAEEAAEVAQAALKLYRVYDGINPARVTEKEAMDKLCEEIGDFWLALKTLGMDEMPYTGIYADNVARKTIRWAETLEKVGVRQGGD